MSEKKKSRGRPRKHATNAERQKAYYERKKERMEKLERQVRKLEGELIQSDGKGFRFIDIDFEREIEWERFTPGEIAAMATPEIQKNLTQLKEIVASALSLNNPLQRIILGTIEGFSPEGKISKDDIKLPELDISKGLADFVDIVQQLTQIHYMEAEIASRKRKMGKPLKMEELATLEKGIKELVKEKSEEVEIKSKQK